MDEHFHKPYEPMEWGPTGGNCTPARQFFPDGNVKPIFICAVGYGGASRLHPLGPRLEFNEVVQIV